MKINNIKAGVFGIMAMLLSSCSSDVDFGEQYQKTLYIVHAADMLYTADHYYSEDANVAEISVYCSGSEVLKNDVAISLALDPGAIKKVNDRGYLANPASYVNKIMLPATHFIEPADVATIRKGTQYGVLPIQFTMEGLDPDVSYVIPVTIVDNNPKYAVNPALQTIVYEIRMNNKFSGSYSGSSRELSPEDVKTVQPVLKAISVNEVRLPVHNITDSKAVQDKDYMVLKVAADNSVTITPWKNAMVSDMGSSVYNADLKQFVLKYSYKKTSDSQPIEIEEIIVNQSAK